MTPVLDTRSVPPADRRDYWSAGIAQHFFPMRVEAVGASSFQARLAGGEMGPVAVRSIQGLPHRVARTPQMIAAADPECILLYLLTRGVIGIEQDDRSCVLQPGDIACQDTSRPSTFEGRDGFEVFVFSVPKWFIGSRADNITRRTATRMDAGERRLTPLATPFLASLARTVAGGEGLSSSDAEGAAEMILPIFRSLYGEEAMPDARSRPELLLTRMQRYAMEHLQDPELGPEQIAQAHYVSTRYVHKLFASSGTGVSAWIRERRLEGAAGELRKSPGTTIATVAARWGYRNPASFSRAFREVHGCAPRDARGFPDPAGKPSPVW
ncbi:helix-turn-helix domain-containing protein [Arthrobacter sp. I2-34]|uniref:Helix-turn-helix domain-containing protein n=1 Tax=Arthrobacter hankyongi TaxID=2904801 RepID=A0ABS9L5L6_9MICC|nr:helix-turn-helix domain-containing protein [Arthrobacter hankyongi]MCG2621977.1 helix-turn-helix domain-containing protein [Arthrobacter hankyongi]